MATEEHQKPVKKSKRKRIIVIGIICCICVFAFPFIFGCAVSVPGFAYTPSFSGQIVDKNGKPIPGAYILYDYQGSHNEIVQSGSDSRNPAIVITDKDGRFIIPSLSQTKPLLESRAKIHIEVGYSPVTHSVFYQSNFLKEWNDEEPNVHVVTLPDYTSDPKAWADSLYHLKFALGCVNDIYLTDPNQNSLQKIQGDFATVIQSEQKLLDQAKK